MRQRSGDNNRRCFYLSFIHCQMTRCSERRREWMLRKPVIGITAAHCTEELKTFPRHYYVESIRKAGGIPFVSGTLAKFCLLGWPCKGISRFWEFVVAFRFWRSQLGGKSIRTFPVNILERWNIGKLLLANTPGTMLIS